MYISSMKRRKMYKAKHSTTQKLRKLIIFQYNFPPFEKSIDEIKEDERIIMQKREEDLKWIGKICPVCKTFKLHEEYIIRYGKYTRCKKCNTKAIRESNKQKDRKVIILVGSVN